MALKVGDLAPDFELPAVEGEQRLKIKLSDFRGKKHVLVTFHPLELDPDLRGTVAGVRLGSREVRRARCPGPGHKHRFNLQPSCMAKHDIGTMHFPMCSDFYPHAEVTQAFGIMREGPPLPGISERAVFIVDKSGKIVFAKVYPLDRTPAIEELLEALKGLQ